MSRKALAAFVVLVAAMLVVAGSALGRTSKTPTLKGVVGPGYTISLTMNGKKVKSLKAGKYKFAITDKSDPPQLQGGVGKGRPFRESRSPRLRSWARRPW